MTGRAQFSGPLVQFGNYLLDEEIARGGMARVYRARLRGLGGFEKPLVVKQVLPELARDPELVRMFVEEAKTLVQMSHPNVVPVYELGVVDGVYFLAMEYVDGATLADVLREGPLPPALAAHVGIQVSDALHYAHRRMGLVHRDVTPRNVIVDRAGHVRLLDFGIAARTEAFAATGPVFGSPGYMAPEQARGEAPLFASDVFSLGAVLYEALSGERAFLRAIPADTRHALFEAALPSFDAFAPEPLASILAKTLARDPNERPTADELGKKLRSWLAQHHPEGVAPELGLRTERPRQRRSARPPSGTPTVTPRSEPSGTVRTLATSPALRPYLARDVVDPGVPPEIKEAIASPPEEPSSGSVRTAPIPGRRPNGTPNRRRALAWMGAVVSVGLVAAAWAGLRANEPAAAPIPAIAPRDAPPRRSRPEPPSNPSPASTPPLHPEPPRSSNVAVEAIAPAPTPPPRPERETAVLSVNATPWAEVYVDGRNVGVTPQRRLTVPVGTRTIELRCPPLGRSVRTELRAGAGTSVKVIADLSAEPPTISVR